MAKVTMKSTKEEILNALHEAEKKLKEQKSVISAPAAASEQAKAEEVTQAAAEDVKSGIFSEEMNAKYENLVEAIALQEKKLKECYDVDAALVDMTVMINAKKQAMMALDAELEQVRTETSAAKAALEAEVSAAKAAMEAERKQQAADLKQARERERSEYDYDLKRARKQEADEYADKMAALAKEKAEAEAALAALTADAEKIHAMETRLDGIDAELEAKYQEGVEAGKKEAGKEYGYKSTMAEKEHSFELRERDGQISRLEKTVEDMTSKIAALESKLDAAYAQLRELATKTVESSGGLKVLTTGGDAGSSRK